jgi:hypothetical protein
MEKSEFAIISAASYTRIYWAKGLFVKNTSDLVTSSVSSSWLNSDLRLSA